MRGDVDLETIIIKSIGMPNFPAARHRVCDVTSEDLQIIVDTILERQYIIPEPSMEEFQLPIPFRCQLTASMLEVFG